MLLLQGCMQKMAGKRNQMKILLFVFLALAPGFLFAQVAGSKADNGLRCSTVVVAGDTLPVMQLEPVNVWGNRTISSTAEARQWDRLVKNVKVAYPYAKLAGIKFKEYSELLAVNGSEREKKLMMKKAEDELQAQFGDELKELTFTQGKILLKLVDRQTSSSSYDIVKEFRGKFVAFFWQGIGKIFGYNLKVKYDPLHEDADIERIVLMIENGRL